MTETINEPITALVTFTEKGIKPLAFRWGKNKYHVKKVMLAHSERKGNGLVYYFSVCDDINYFKLAFDTRNFSWRLLELSS